ncbi:MAG TPA: hypothetical protein VH643_28370 [Gemmataceae bacterium]|jgi:hypothetical protein
MRISEYDFRRLPLRWLENGKPVEQTRTVDVSARDMTRVDFTKPRPSHAVDSDEAPRDQWSRG